MSKKLFFRIEEILKLLPDDLQLKSRTDISEFIRTLLELVAEGGGWYICTDIEGCVYGDQITHLHGTIRCLLSQKLVEKIRKEIRCFIRKKGFTATNFNFGCNESNLTFSFLIEEPFIVADIEIPVDETVKDFSIVRQLLEKEWEKLQRGIGIRLAWEERRKRWRNFLNKLLNKEEL